MSYRCNGGQIIRQDNERGSHNKSKTFDLNKSGEIMRACYHRDAVFKVPRHLMIRVSQSVSLSFQHRSCSSTLRRLAPILEAWLPSCAHIVSFLILFSSYQHAGATLPFQMDGAKPFCFQPSKQKAASDFDDGCNMSKINGTIAPFHPI